MKDNGFWVYYVKGEIIRYPAFANYSVSDRDTVRVYVCQSLPQAGFMKECVDCYRRFSCATERNKLPV